jgi:hypothetical protein
MVAKIKRDDMGIRKRTNVNSSYTYIIPALYQNERRCGNERSEKLMRTVLKDQGAKNTPK